MARLLLLFIIPFALFAGELKLIEGSVKAHTEVFGDSTINPATNKVAVNLTMDNGIESIIGEVTINALDLVSDNKDRDVHMHETLESNGYPTISFKISNIKKTDEGYILGGILNLHGNLKGLELKSDITQNGNIVNLQSNFTIKMSAYGIKPPKLLFLTVRDEVDIDVTLQLAGE